MGATTVVERFVPCPWCHGSGGHTEYVPGLGDGPHYDCTGCWGIGTVWAYKRVKQWQETLWQRTEAVTCVCGHTADRHYDRFDHCAWESDDSQSNGYIRQCHCRLSQKTLMLNARETLLTAQAPGLPGSGSGGKE